jgi:hypothetical protein
MMAVAGISVLDGLINSLSHCISMSLEASRYTVFGVQDDSSKRLVDLNVDGQLSLVLTFLETERTRIHDYRPAQVCAECIQHTTKKIQAVLDEITKKIYDHEHMLLRHWYTAGCDDQFESLKSLLEFMNKEFKLLLKLLSLCPKRPVVV